MLDEFLAQYPVSLTEQEEAVLRLMINGDTDKVIAQKMGTDWTAIRLRVKSIFRKLGVNNRTKAAVWGWMWGYDSSRN